MQKTPDERPDAATGPGEELPTAPTAASLLDETKHLLAHLTRIGVSVLPMSLAEQRLEDLRHLEEAHGIRLGALPGEIDGAQRLAGSASHERSEPVPLASHLGPAEVGGQENSLRERRRQAGEAIAKRAFGGGVSTSGGETGHAPRSAERHAGAMGRLGQGGGATNEGAGGRGAGQKEVVAGDERRYGLPVLSSQERADALNRCAEDVSQCTACPALVMNRKQTVFGEGSVEPRFCFFGEAPGAEEDRSGRPFVGPAGQLLTKMIEACTLSREEVYILNTVKCRPPGNRNPELEEVAACRHFFEYQFEVLQPEYIVCLGAVAVRALLNTTLSVGRLRGVFHQYRQSKVLVTYHPSYLLRQPEAKRAAWEDLQLLIRDAGIQLPGAKKPRPKG